MSKRWRGLYVITPEDPPVPDDRTPARPGSADPAFDPGSDPWSEERATERLAAAVEQAIAGGAVMVQFRDKRPDPGPREARAVLPTQPGARRDEQREARARAVLAVCRAAGVPLIVNDDLELAWRIGADGVHLGRDDGDPATARARLGSGAILGVSCYDRLDLALAAADAGADYVAFGSFFPSPTKPRAVRPEPTLLTAARARLDLPLVAIGGIRPDNGGPLIAAGADLLAVVTGVFAAPDIRRAARAYTSLFRPTREENPS